MALLYRMGTGNGSGSDIKPYTVNFECASGYIGQTLTMTYKGTPHAGETVDNVSGTVGSDGTLTLYPMHSGEWECSCYSSVTGTTMKKTIDLSYWGVHPTVTFEDTPNGATVTPTDDVQTWLHCANIWDKTDLTTIDDVIADTTTLNILISDNNASDYLARSTTWTSSIVANQSAMTYIGLNDYCANKLLADSTWLEAICSTEETLLKKVLNVFVPTLTSNTGSDGGEVTYSVNNNTYPAWTAFSNKSTVMGGGIGVTDGDYIGYRFPIPVICKLVCLTMLGGSSNTVSSGSFAIYGVNNKDYSNKVKVSQNVDFSITYVNTKTCRLIIDNNIAYDEYILVIDKYTSSFKGAYLNPLQFYGREEA